MNDEEIIKKIKDLLEQIRPNIQMDGGDLEFVNFEDGVVYLKLHGACRDCPASANTFKVGVEEYLKNHVDEVREIEIVE